MVDTPIVRVTFSTKTDANRVPVIVVTVVSLTPRTQGNYSTITYQEAKELLSRLTDTSRKGVEGLSLLNGLEIVIIGALKTQIVAYLTEFFDASPVGG